MVRLVQLEVKRLFYFILSYAWLLARDDDFIIRACSRWRKIQKLIVMARHGILLCADCVNLSALPAIHVLTTRQRKTWMPAPNAGMTI